MRNFIITALAFIALAFLWHYVIDPHGTGACSDGSAYEDCLDTH